MASVGEAEEILQTLWFGWFEGIYNQDEDRIREVVGTQAMLDAARSQFGVMEFEAAPTTEGVQFETSEILEIGRRLLGPVGERPALTFPVLIEP